ncbi:MAG: NusG domain II-containing protein [Oscillospiraceae bacterium]|jgi:hypothetical protein|nr:NusG domain II-containing protein [Oscillospiraceae bacterium]
MGVYGQAVKAAAVISVVAVVSLAAWIWIDGLRFGEPTARIYKNGELIYTVYLSRVAEPYEIDVGGVNTVEVRKGEIGVIHASCPDKLCVRTGFVSGAVPIVCLPNRLEIRIRDDASDLDGVTR